MNSLILLGVSVFLFSIPGHASSCFCKIICAWNGDDSSDFYKVIDVSCPDPLEEKKKNARELLMQHVKEIHPDFSSTEVKSKTEIMCYDANVNNSATQKNKFNKK
jgi:hypothetical protein